MNKLVLSLVALFVLAGCAKGPDDQQLKTLLSEVHRQLMSKEQPFKVNDSIVGTLLAASGKDFDVMEIEGRQLHFFTGKSTFAQSNSLKSWISPRIEELATRSDKDGATALYLKEILFPVDHGFDCENLKRLLQNPGTAEFVKDDSIYAGVFSFFTYVGCEPAQKAELVKLALPLITSDLAVDQAYQAKFVFDVALALGDELPAADLDAVRTAVLKQYERILPLVDENLKPRIENGIIFLNSLYAKRQLIGSEAPELDFIWTSGGKFQKLSDLKGKVVVVDFWATWCGPCVASFPNIRELQKRYKGYPVEIIGVTSLQGRHIDRSGEKPETVDTKGKPEMEYSLMKDFMKYMDMNWKVAFSKQYVFNPEYGVTGIPHVAIIDAEGKVRYNDLRPYEPPFHEAQKIDELLKEAGLKYPSKPMETTNFVH